MQRSRGRRHGSNFTIRVSDEHRARLEALQAADDGPRALGPWLVWRALAVPAPAAAVPGSGSARALSAPGQCPLERQCPLEAIAAAVPARPSGQCHAGEAVPRLVLDLCGGSGAWSRPYREAGYEVRVITLPEHDVRDYRPPPNVWGVLAAPPCTEFSIAKTTGERDLLTGLETITACLRIVAEARPRWWALENPGSGLLRRWLGTPRDVWQPCDFGDPWTKLTALWGDFALPRRRHVRPLSGMPGTTAAARAVTPPGFARAFFEANP